MVVRRKPTAYPAPAISAWLSAHAAASSRWRRLGAPALAVAAFVVFLWLVTGVRAGEIVVYVTYEFTFVLLPGWLVYRAFSPPRGRLRELVFGWTLGYLLEILAFFVTASLGIRGALPLYPILVGVPAAMLAWRRRGETAAALALPSRRILWTGAGLLIVLLGYAAAVGFSQTPLPRDAGIVTYQEDTLFVISLAADALHHWPMTLPMVNGEPLNYHLFAFMHFAAISQVTGIDLSVVIMRLYEGPLLLLFALSLVLAGRRVARTWGAGLAALAVVAFFGELDAATGTETGRFLFRDLFFYWLLASHTFLLGLVFFVPALILAADIVDERRRLTPFELLLFGGFVVGCVGTKSYSVFVIAGALVVFVLWHAMAARRLHRRAATAVGITALVYLVANVAVFGFNSAGAQVKPFTNLKTMFGVEELNTYFTHVWATSHTYSFITVPYGVFGLLGVTLAGLAARLRYGRAPLSAVEVLFVACGVVVSPILLFSSQPGYGQMFLVFFGLVPVTIVGANGFRLAWLAEGPRLYRTAWPWLVLGVAVLVVVGSLEGASQRVTLQLGLFVCGAGLLVCWFAPRVGRVLTAVALLALVAPLVALVRDPSVARGVAAALVVAAIALALRQRPSGVVGAVVAGVLILGLVNTPLDWFPRLAGRALHGEPVYSRDFSGLTSDLYAGLTWIRERTPTNAVLAVNNHSLHPDGRDSKYFYYSAFAERRVELESWDYSVQTISKGYFSLPVAQSPFPYRLALADDVFQRGDERALRALARQYGVDYLVVDKVHGSASPEFAQLVPRVFSNDGIDVYEVGRPGHWLCHSSQGAGVVAVFAHARTPRGLDRLRSAAEGVGFTGLTPQRRGCFDYALVLTGLASYEQAREFRAEADRVGFHVRLECRSTAPTGRLNAVFGHRRTRAAALRLERDVAGLGYDRLRVRQDACGDWEVDAPAPASAASRERFRASARSVGAAVRFEPG